MLTRPRARKRLGGCSTDSSHLIVCRVKNLLALISPYHVNIGDTEFLLVANSPHRRKSGGQGGPPSKNYMNNGMNIVSFSNVAIEEWSPTEEQLQNQVNSAIEDIRSVLNSIQKDIGASDRYLLGILDVIADDYRAQLPAGKS